MKHVVIVGGGTGGTIAANVLARKTSKDKVKITLIDKSGKHYYQPAFLYTALGEIKSESSVVRDESQLISKRVRLIIDEAVKIDPADRRVDLAKGGSLNYDYLIIATGARIVPEEVPGYEASYNFYDYQSALKLRRALESFKGGVIAIGVGGIPYKCPPAPGEFSCLLDYYFNRRGIRDKVEIHFLYPLPRPFPERSVAGVMMELMERKNIHFHPMFNIEYIDPKKKIVYSLEGEELKFDLLVMVPPHKGAKVVENSDIKAPGGWITVDKYTLNLPDYDDAYAIGDATDLPISKAGVVAHYEGKVVAERIAAEVAGKEPTSRYDGTVRCFCDAGYRKAITIKFNYETPPKKPKPSFIWYIMKMLVNKTYWSLVLKGWV